MEHLFCSYVEYMKLWHHFRNTYIFSLRSCSCFLFVFHQISKFASQPQPTQVMTKSELLLDKFLNQWFKSIPRRHLFMLRDNKLVMKITASNIQHRQRYLLMNLNLKQLTGMGLLVMDQEKAWHSLSTNIKMLYFTKN